MELSNCSIKEFFAPQKDKHVVVCTSPEMNVVIAFWSLCALCSTVVSLPVH